MSAKRTAMDARIYEIARDLETLGSSLGRLRRLVRLSALLRGTALVVLTALALSILSFVLDRTFRLSWEWRAGALVAYGALLAAALWRLCLRPLLLSIPDSSVADVVERHFPRLEDLVRSAVDFRSDVLRRPAEFRGPVPGTSEAAEVQAAMKVRVLAQASEALRGLPLEEIVNLPAVARAAALGLSAGAAAVVLSVFFGTTCRTWFERNVLLGSVEWPYRTVLEVEGFSADRPSLGVPRGDRLVLRVRARGEIPDRVRIRIRYPRETQRWNLAREGEDVFVHEQTEVTEAFEFRVEGGDYRSPRYRVEVLERPEIEACRVTLKPPAYTGKPARILEQDFGDLTIPEGTRVEIDALSTKPLRAAWLEAEGRRIPLSVEGSDSRRLSGGWIPESGGLATVHLEDLEGVPPNRWLRLLVNPVRDAAPKVSIKAEGVGGMILARAVIPLKVKATDDYGITALGVSYEVIAEGAPPRTGEGEPEATDGGPEVARDIAWDVQPLGLAEDRRLDVKVFAVDNDGLRGPKRGYSQAEAFLIVSVERLLEDFLTREEEQRRILERALEDQRVLRDTAYRMVDEAWKREGPVGEPALSEMVRMARKERELARQMASISQAMKAILDEMRNNRIAEAAETERLLGGVIAPLAELSETALPLLSARIGTIRELARPEDRIREGVALAFGMEEAIATMDKVLLAMKRLEGFTEVVNRLHAVLKIHSESAEEAAKLYRKQIEEIFETGPTESGSK